jgi:large-conductance mechanosensitive channel
MARTSADTHTALLLNRVTNYLAIAFVVFLLVSFISVWTVRYAVDRNCQDPYKRHVELFHYWIDLDIGSNKIGCPTP